MCDITQVMKIDVEGFELQVLEGAEELLKNHNVWWVDSWQQQMRVVASLQLTLSGKHRQRDKSAVYCLRASPAAHLLSLALAD